MSVHLGLSFGFHDSAAAAICDGKVIAYATEERFSRQKHDRACPWQALEYCMRKAGIASAAEATTVSFHETPEHAFTRVLTSSLAGFPHSRREFTSAMRSWLGQKLWTRTTICRRLGIDPSRLQTWRHHRSHASQVFHSSGFARHGGAAILTIDAVGEWDCTGLYRGNPDGTIDEIAAANYPHSLGLFYAAMTAFLGFKPMDGECSLMALAAFGQPRYRSALANMLILDADKSSDLYELAPGYFEFDRFYRQPWTKKVEQLLGPPRALQTQLDFDCLQTTPLIQNSERYQNDFLEAQRFADIAASVQSIFTDAVIKIARYLRHQVDNERLCLAGGGALNCLANHALAQSGLFKDIFIAPDPGDGGAAVGAAMQSYWNTSAKPAVSTAISIGWTQGCGDHPKAEELNFAPLIRPLHAQRYRRPDLSRDEFTLEQQTYDGADRLIDAVSKHLLDAQIVGWVQDGFEAGPRALGRRSIFIRPDSVELARRLSREVKARAAYRPYALTMAYEQAPQVIENGLLPLTAYPWRWMQLVAPVRHEWVSRLRSGLHTDGTTRPQVVHYEDQPMTHTLLQKWEAISGLPALVNTSFNESGYPIVATAVEAFAVFLRTAMDVLVVENTVYRKVRVKQ